MEIQTIRERGDIGGLDKSFNAYASRLKMIIWLSACDGLYGGLTAASSSPH